MLAAQRHSLILQEVSLRSAARIAELADTLNVSEMTVRRDIEVLAEQGLLEKVHGGATAVLEKSMVTEPPFTSKSLREQIAKDSIAARASEEVHPGDSIALMGGSTVFAMAKFVAKIPRLTIVTNSLPVSDLLNREGLGDQTVILAGGLRTPTDSFVGAIAIDAFRSLNLDMVFMGTHGMDLKGGYSSPNLLEAETNRAVRGRAKKLILLADHTKWGEIGFSTFAKLEDADMLITDQGLPNEALNELRNLVKEVVVVSA